MPKVSVIIPSYNHERFIKEAINSVLNQTFQDFEIIIVDDGSRDNSVEIINSFKDKRIKVFVFEENRGAVVATNFAIEQATGQYISLLNSDDAYFPDKLEKQVEYLEKHQDISVVFGFAQAINNDSNEVKPNPEYFEPREINMEPKEWLKTFYYKGNWIIHPTMMIRKSVFNTCGKYDERLAQVPDFLEWVKLAFHENKFHILMDKLVRYRFHEDNASSGKKPGVPDRLIHEYQFILEQYLDNINCLDQLKQIFPDISKNIYYCEDEEVIKFLSALAMYTTDVRGDEVHALRKYIALQRLYKLFDDHNYAKKINKKCNFYYPDLIRLSGKYHLFLNEIDQEKFNSLEKIEKSITWRLLSKIRRYFLDILIPNRKTIISKSKLKKIFPFMSKKRKRLDQQTRHYSKLLTILYNPKLGNNGKELREALPENVIIEESNKITSENDSKYYFHSNKSPVIEALEIERNLFILEKYAYDAIFCFNLDIDVENRTKFTLQRIVSSIQNSMVYRIFIRKDQFGTNFNELLNTEKTNFIPLFLLGFAVKNKLRIKIIDLARNKEIIIDHKDSQPIQIGRYVISAMEHKEFNTINKIEYCIENSKNIYNSKISANGILFALPFILDAGENHLVRKIVKNFSGHNFKSSIITTLNVEPDYLGFGDGNPKYREITKDIHHLYKLFDRQYWKDYIDYLIQTRQIKTIYIIGCEYLYKLLPEIRRKYPEIKIIDELFNEVGHLDNNRKYSKYIDLTIVENNNLQNLLIDKYGEKKDKLKIIESGIDTENLFNPNKYNRKTNQNKYNLSDKDLNALFLGRLSPEKSPMKFVAIANRLKKYSNIQFSIAGDGELKSEVFKKIGDLGIQDNVHILGMVDSTEILSSIDLLVLPSDYDGRPLAVLEALSMGVPVIASNVGGLPDVIKNGVTGYLVDPKDIDGFANKIQELYENPKLLKTLSENARSFAIKNFSEKKMYDAYTKAIQDILKTR